VVKNLVIFVLALTTSVICRAEGWVFSVIHPKPEQKSETFYILANDKKQTVSVTLGKTQWICAVTKTQKIMQYRFRDIICTKENDTVTATVHCDTNFTNPVEGQTDISINKYGLILKCM
jgi:hypothetical protein